MAVEFVICPLCGDPEMPEDIVSGVCLTCADAIAFSQNARRGAVVVTTEEVHCSGCSGWVSHGPHDEGYECDGI